MRKTASMTVVAAALALALVGSWATASKRSDAAQAPVAAEKMAATVAAAGFDGGLAFDPSYDPTRNPEYDVMQSIQAVGDGSAGG